MEPWNLSSPVVTLTTGIEIEGESARLFFDASYAPTLVQLKAGDKFLEIPMSQVASVKHT